MSVENTPTGTEIPAAGEPATPASGLPSDVTANQVNLDGFQLSEEFVTENFKDGKLKGRFNSVEEVLEKLKEAEDFKANTMRDKTEAEKIEAEKAQQANVQAQTATVQQETIMGLLPEFMANDMTLTPEMEAKATDAGIDIRDLKLGALELKDRVTKAHAVIGSADEYNAMLDWGKTNMTDAQRAAFDKDVTGNMSEYAIKGLHSDYKTALENGHTPQRIEGDGAPRGLQPYGDRNEVYKDRDYLRTPAGKADTQAQRNHKARLAITPNVVLGIN